MNFIFNFYVTSSYITFTNIVCTLIQIEIKAARVYAV